jgi:hypothetical protein
MTYAATKPLFVELAERQQLSRLVEAKEAPVFMHLALLMVFLRRVGGLIALMNEHVAKDKGIGCLCRSRARLSIGDA